ncbi:MAG: hypothetical protein ACYCY2_00300 [Acidithiobacillus ferriphilus]
MSLAKGLYRAFNLPLESLSDLHGVDYGGAKNLREAPLDAFLDNGGLIRYGILQGDYSTPDPDLYQAMLRKLQDSWVTLFRQPGHSLDISFHVDPARSTEFLERRLAPYRRQAEKHGLDFAALFDSRVRDFPKHIAPEVVIVALRTDPSILLANEQKRANEARKKRREKTHLGDWIRGGQDVTAIMPELRHIHDQAWYTLVKSLDTCGNVLMDGQSRNNGLLLSALNIEQAIDWIRNIQRPGTYSLPSETPTWKADLARPSVGVHGTFVATAPRLGLSAIPEEMEVAGGGVVKTSQGMCFAPVVMSLGPVHTLPFGELLENLVKANIPVRINFRLIPGGTGGLSMKKIGAEMLYLTTKMTDNGNGLVKEAINEIQRHANYDPVILMRSVACTWAASEEQAQMQQQTLLRMIETWGNQEATTRCGDPVQTVLSSIPGLVSNMAAPVWPANLSNVLPLMPFDRPASPWTHGPFFLRDKLRKMLAVGHDLQTPIISFTGPPGRGKSMTMALQLLSYLWDAGQGDLPYISIIDVGYSSIEFIEAVRQALGEKAYLAQGFTLSLNGNTINPFDTPLGFRFPTENHLSFLKNLIGVICGNTRENPILKLPEAIGAAMLACYGSVADMGQGKAKPYQVGVDVQVDEAIARYGIFTDKTMSWWEIVDALFAKKDLPMAGRAQRFAVPIFLDFITTCTSNNDLQAKYGDLKVQGQMPLISYINLSVNEAAKNWPVMASPSTFDFGQARIVSLDLVEVTQGQDESSIRQATAMYLLARFKTSQSFIFSKDDVDGAKNHLLPEYARYHTDRAAQIKRDVKIAVWDELHRTGGLPQISDQIERDGREGRKNGLRILLGSQSFRDIPDTIQDILGAAYVMGLDGKEIETIVERTGIDPILAAKAVDHCIGPGDKGSGALVYWKREDRRYTSLAYVIAGPVELWALTTHPESRAVKVMILREVPYSATLNLLAARYPSGTIKGELARRKGLAQGGEDFLTEIAQEIVRMYQVSLLQSASPLQGATLLREP